jgi:hypothetical protein
MPEALRNYGPLSTYSTFNFENQLGKCISLPFLFFCAFTSAKRLGLLTRSCKSTRRHAVEIMNNLMYLRHACYELIDVDMNLDFFKLVTSWLHMNQSSSASTNDRIRALHPVKIIDQFFNSVFMGDIVYYSTAFIRRVRFTTTHYARNKVSDDSSIIFKVGSKESFGRIHRIFTVNGGEPMFYVGVILKMNDFECTTDTHTYSYSQIQTGSFEEGTNSVFIGGNDIVEKCVFYERNNKVCTFYRFPNSQECS